MAGYSGKNALIVQGAEEPKLIRPTNMCRYVAILTILCMTTFYSGYCHAYLTALGSSNVKLIYGDITLKPVVKAFLISSMPFGVTFGNFLNPWILPLASRRNLTLILCVIAGGLGLIIQVQNLGVFFLMRFSQGIVTGLLLVVVPAYVRQISPKQINKRGVFGIFGQLFVIIGFMFVFGINIIFIQAGTDQFVRWRLVISLNFFPLLAIIIGILTKIIPESPNALILKGEIDEAKEVIAMFHRQSAVEEVFKQKLKQIEDANKPPAPPAKDRPIIHTILTFQLPIMHQMTGVISFISQIGFITATFHKKLADYVPFMMGTTQVIAAIYALVYFKQVTRKSLVLAGNLGMSLCCIGIGISYELTSRYQEMFFVIVALIVIFMGFNGATLVPGVSSYVSQIGTKQEIRWSQVTGWFAAGTNVTLFVYIGQTFGYEPVFFTFGIFTMICFVFNAAFMIKIKPKLKDVVNVELGKLNLNTNETEDGRYDMEKQ